MTEEDTNIESLGFNDALKALDNASSAFKVEVWVPSIQKNLTFKEIDAKQQKNLLNAAIDTSVYTSDFIKVFYQILKENLLDENNSIIDTLTVDDKTSIAIALRCQISEEFNVKFNDEVTEKINLTEILNKFKNYQTPQSEVLDSESNNVKLAVEIANPTIKTELNFNENFSKEYKKEEEIKNNKELRNLISEAFICEISKYIKNIKVNNVDFSFGSLSFNQKIKIIEKLPSGILQKILEKISEWKLSVSDILTVKKGDLTKVISVDSLLFLS
jgi:hypothetical protein